MKKTKKGGRSRKELDEQDEYIARPQKRCKEPEDQHSSNLIKNLNQKYTKARHGSNSSHKLDKQIGKGNQLVIDDGYKVDQNILIYEEIMNLLRGYYQPSQIPCREKEKEAIKSFLTKGIQNNGSSSSLYISGIPGIGKTVSYLEVIKELQQNGWKFNFIHVNGMNISSPEQVYQILFKSIFNVRRKVRPHKACQLIDNYFRYSKVDSSIFTLHNGLNRTVNVLLLDEMDFLVTKNQNVLYNIFEWPQHSNSRLVITGISNTSDLPEKFQQKIKSRLGYSRVTYKPYNYQQIQKIIKTRIKGIRYYDKVFSEEIIDFISAKVSRYSSDIRKTLQLCSNSVGMARIRYEKMAKSKAGSIQIEQVNTEDITVSHEKMYNNETIEFIKYSSQHDKLFMVSFYNLVMQSNDNQSCYFQCLVSEFVKNHRLIKQRDKQCQSDNIDSQQFRINIDLDWSSVWRLVEKYNNAGFLGIEKKMWEKQNDDFNVQRGFVDYLVFPKIHVDDIAYAIVKDDNQAFKSLLYNQ